MEMNEKRARTRDELCSQHAEMTVADVKSTVKRKYTPPCCQRIGIGATKTGKGKGTYVSETTPTSVLGS